MFKLTHLRNHLFSCVLDECCFAAHAASMQELADLINNSADSSLLLVSFFLITFISVFSLSDFLLLFLLFFVFAFLAPLCSFFARGLSVCPILSSVCFSFLLPADFLPLIEQQLLNWLTLQSFNDNLIPSIPPSSCLSLLSQFIWPLIWSSLSWGSDHTRACNDSTFIN